MAVIDTSIAEESKNRYLTYALSVVSGRALPDVRDGLKPVQRRILYSMYKNLHLLPSHSYRKSASVVGDVLAKFHPHGDVACYEAMVRMAQTFSLRYPLVDGQGNFGSVDGDNAAAYRYTEAKLLPIALEVIGEIDEEAVPFRDNFDGSQVEPIVFPARVPNLLINGASGIAVGMATSIPPHNLRDTVKALIELLDDPDLNNTKLSAIIKGPDFPTGCSILNTRSELKTMYETGKGSIRMRGEWKLEEGNRGKRFIIITSIPYAINKSQLVEKIANLIIDKKLPQLNDVRDESTDDVRVVLELAPGADPELAMAYLYKHTPIESNFSVNLTALVPAEGVACKPELLSLKDCLSHFLIFRKDVVQKRLIFEKKQLAARVHILDGLIIVFDDLDTAIKIVRKSDGRADAAAKLRERFKLTEIQAFAVVDMRIYQLSKTNIDEIRAELEAKQKRLDEIDGILKSKKKISDLVKKDLEDVNEKFGDKRKSKLDQDNIEIEFNEADYVVNEEVFAIVTADGWLKRIRQNNELDSTRLREGDRILQAHALSSLDSVAFFTTQGSLYILKVTEFPASSGYGDPIQKILKFKDGEQVVASFGVKAAQKGAAVDSGASLLRNGDKIALISKDGVGYGLTIADLEVTKRIGKRVLKLREGDTLAAVTHLRKQLLMFTRKGSGLSISTGDVPIRESAAIGVSLMGVRDDDALVSAVSVYGKQTLIVTADGGKTREISSSDVVSGHRALKGNKVISRGEIESVHVAKSEQVILLR